MTNKQRRLDNIKTAIMIIFMVVINICFIATYIVGFLSIWFFVFDVTYWSTIINLKVFIALLITGIAFTTLADCINEFIN